MRWLCILTNLSTSYYQKISAIITKLIVSVVLIVFINSKFDCFHVLLWVCICFGMLPEIRIITIGNNRTIMFNRIVSCTCVVC